MVTETSDEAGGGELLERQAELAALDRALSAGGRLVVIEAPAGAGKSALLTRTRAQAHAAGMRVLSARGSDLERALPFGVAVQLFGPRLAALDADERARLLAGAAAPVAALFGAGGVATTAGDDDLVLLQGLHWLSESVARTPAPAPLLIAVDDAHWADAPTLRLLAFLAARLSELPATLVIALRPDEPHADGADVLERLRLHAGSAGTLRPGPLSDAAVAQLVRATFPDAAVPFAQACARATRGNPFLVRELVTSLRDDGVRPTAEQAETVERLVPDTVLRSVLVRLGRLHADAHALAGAVAVLGDGAALVHAASLAELDAAAAADAADALAAAHLLAPGEPLRFTHPLIATAVHADLAPFARARAHRAAATLLAGAGTPAEVPAAHLLACGPCADGWVVATLRRAASHARAAGEPAAAARFLARALEEPPADDDRVEVQVELALAEAAAGAAGADARLRDALALIDTPRRRAEALLGLCRLLAARADFGPAADAAEEALRQLPADDPLAGRLLSVLLDSSSRHAPRRGDALARFQPLVEAARAGETPAEPALQARLASRLVVAGDPADRPRAIALAERAIGAGPLVDDDFHGIPLAFAAGALYWSDELERCRVVTADALEAARRRGSTIALACATHWHAAPCHRLGRLEEAAVAAQRGLELARGGWTAVVGWTAPLLAVVELERGALDAARAALDAADQTDPELMERAFALEARGRLALATDDAAGALALFEAAGAHLRDRYRIDNPAVLAWRSQAAIALARSRDSGAASEAAALVEQELAAARRGGLARPVGQALRAAGVVASSPERGIELLREAVATLSDSPAALSRAHALADLGAALRRSGQRRAAREPLREALKLAERFGAAPLQESAGAELRAAGGRRSRARELSGPQSLTPTERRIAELAALGHSNPGIAQRLFLATKTVEWHLGHVYGKLGIGSRHQLAAALGDLGDA